LSKIEEAAAAKNLADQEDHDKLKENLRAVDEDEGGYGAKLNDQVKADKELEKEMELARRDEDAFRA